MASAGPYASLHLAPDRQPRQHPTTRFYRPDALPAAQPTASKHWRQKKRDRPPGLSKNLLDRSLPNFQSWWTVICNKLLDPSKDVDTATNFCWFYLQNWILYVVASGAAGRANVKLYPASSYIHYVEKTRTIWQIILTSGVEENALQVWAHALHVVIAVRVRSEFILFVKCLC